MNLSEIEFPVFVIALIANIALVLIVFRYAPKNRSRIFFVLFGLSQTIWILVNYFAARSNADSILDMARWTIAAAVPHPVLFFLFIHYFLIKKDTVNRTYIWILTALVASFILLARSPFLFTHLEIKNGVPTPIAGFGIAMFGIYAFTFVIASFVHIYKSWRIAQGIERVQWRLIGIGLFLTFILVLTFNFILPVVSDQIVYVNFGHIYTLPFVIFTAYAMIRHKLLNIKSLLAELAVVILNLILIIQLVNSTSVSQFIVGFLVLIGTLIVSVLLVRSVIKEVKQREQLEILDKQLESANVKLKVLDQARADFISIASHQLRTPPASIKWYLAAILDGDYGKFDDSVKDQLRKTASTNNSMIALIDDLLNASRIERGKMEFVFVPTNLAEITQITVDQLLPQAEIRKLNLVFQKPKVELPIITADKEKLRQVINNLIDNAIKYTTQGKIEVTVIQKNKDLVFKVTDSGRGVTPDQIKGIFEKYERGKSAARNSSGLGLGLYVAKVIIEQHKGKIWVESKGEGKGSSFFFSIPIKGQVANTEFDLAKAQVVTAKTT